MARLYLSGPMPFATLASYMAASRDTLTETLAKLEANGVIERRHVGRRTGYALTPLGRRVGEKCVPLVALVGRTGTLEVALKKWPMLVLTALGRGATRYNEAKAALPGITARALAIALKDLQSAGMIERTVEQGYPPAPLYQLAPLGEEFFPPLDELCSACESPEPAETADLMGTET